MRNKTYYIITIGCQMNKSDSERIAGYLERRGFILSQKRDKAALAVITTCGVRQSAEDRVYGLVPEIKRKNRKARIILTGCLSDRGDVKKRLRDYVDIWLPITELNRLADKLDLKKAGNKKEANLPQGILASKGIFKGSLGSYLNISPKYQSSFSAFVPIGNGCDNFCAYCVVPYARGREVYRPAGEILEEAKNLVKRGYREIVLIAQNVNSYKYNANAANDMRMLRIANKKIIGFPELLMMINEIPGKFWIRFATSHPKDMSDELIKAIAECDKVCEHVHLPVQAGDNEILRRMNRKYTREHYLELIRKIRELNSNPAKAGQIPNSKQTQNSKLKTRNFELSVSITTDIIVGFPGETKKQFNQTAKLFREVKFDMAYIAKYSPRFGTASSKMKDDVPKAEKKRREEELGEILKKTALANSKKYVGKIVEVLVEGENKRGEWFGKTRTSKQVRIKKIVSSKQEIEIGNFCRVKIDKVRDFGMEGELVSKRFTLLNPALKGGSRSEFNRVKKYPL